jgi:hypothetical protein
MLRSVPKKTQKSQTTPKRTKTTQRSNVFKTTKPTQNSRRDKFAEAVLNIVPPKKPEQYSLSTKPVSKVGDILPTGAQLAPQKAKALKDQYDINKVKNKIPLPADRSLTKQLIRRRRLFFNTFPRTAASPAGPILQTAYANYAIYRNTIDWSKRMPECDIKISVKERMDYTDRFDTRWYAEAMPRPRARVELNIKNFQFMTKLERDLLGEILGPRYNWQTGAIVLSIGNLRHIHASINRCFQLVHEAAFRAIEIAPHIAAQQETEGNKYKSQVALIEAEEAKIKTVLSQGKQFYTRDAAKLNGPFNQFLTADSQHFIPYNPEFSIDDHAKYIPRISLENMLLTDTVPPGMAQPLKRRKDFDQAALDANPELDPEQIVSPNLEPYSYMSRARVIGSFAPSLFDGQHVEDEKINGPGLTVTQQIFNVADEDYYEATSDIEAFVAGAVLERAIHPLDMQKAVKEIKAERDNGERRLDWLLQSDGEKVDSDAFF